jgi:hypothetical protein
MKERSDNKKDKRLEEIEAKCMKETAIQRNEGKDEANHFSCHI